MWAWSSVKGPPPAWALQLNRKSWLWVVLWAVPLLAQQGTGQLRLTVRDATGLGVEASGELVSQANQVRQAFHTDPEGRYEAKDLPFGLYLLRVERSGFAPFSTLLEIRSELPRDYQVRLVVAPLEATVLVADSATLLDPYRTGPVFRLGPETLRDRRPPNPAVPCWNWCKRSRAGCWRRTACCTPEALSTPRSMSLTGSPHRQSLSRFRPGAGSRTAPVPECAHRQLPGRIRTETWWGDRGRDHSERRTGLSWKGGAAGGQLRDSK